MDQEVVQALDAGALTPQQYAHVLQQAAQQLGAAQGQFLPVLNAGRERVVLDTSGTSLNFGRLCEEYCRPEDIQQAKLSLCIVAYGGDLSQRRKKRAGSLPDGIKYEGNGFPGRVNFLPSDKATVPIIGKQTAAWDRYKHSTVTHKVSGSMVHLVQPNPAMQRFRSRVVSARAADGGVVLTLAEQHPFKSGANCVSLSGMHPGLNGHLEVFKKESPTSFLIKPGRGTEVDFDALNAALAQPESAAVAEELYTLMPDLCLYHIVVQPTAATVAAAAGVAAAVPALPQAVAAPAPVAPAAPALMQFGQLFGARPPPGMPMLGPFLLGPPGMQGVQGQGQPAIPAPAAVMGVWQQQQQQQLTAAPWSQGLALAPQPQQQQQPQQPQQAPRSLVGSLLQGQQQPQQSSGGLVRMLFGGPAQVQQPSAGAPTVSPQPQSRPSSMLGGLLLVGEPAAGQAPASSTARLQGPPAVQEAESPVTGESPVGGAGGGPEGAAESSGGNGGGGGGSGGGGSPPPSSGAGRGAAPLRYFFSDEAVVGGQDPGSGAFPGRALAVQGNALVTGELRVEGGLQAVSDMRRKADIAVVTDLQTCIKLAAGIAIHTFRFRGQQAQQLGYSAQQVAEQVKLHGAQHFNLVRTGPDGVQSLDLMGNVALLHNALKGTMKDVQLLKQVEVSFLITAVGRLDTRMDAVNALLRQLQNSIASVATGAQQQMQLGFNGTAASSSGRLLRGGSGQGDRSSSTLSSILEDADDLGEGLEEAEMEEAPDSTASGPAAPAADSMFGGLSDEQVVQKLVQALGEPQQNAKLFEKFVEELGREALQEVYEQAISSAPELTAQGDRPRSLGGHFIKLTKIRVQQEKMRRKIDKAASMPEAQLRSYQQQVVDMVQTNANLIVVMPTGAGKTLIAIAHSAWVLEGDPQQRIVFLAPTVALAQQQAAAFLARPPFSTGTFKVDCRCSENPVAPREWDSILQANHVLVMTPQSYLNLLDGGYAHMDRIDILILDECHHAQNDHSMARIMAHYHKSSKRAQVIGLTAAPASKSSMDATYRGLDTLQRNLDATYVVLDPDNSELREHVPRVNERAPILVSQRPEDCQLGQRLGEFVVKAVEELSPLVHMPDELCLPREVRQMLLQGRWCATAARWCLRAAAQLQQRPGTQQRHDLGCCLLLVRGAVASLALVADTGYEAAVRHLSKEVASVAEKMVGSLEGLEELLATAAASTASATGPSSATDQGFVLTARLLHSLLNNALDVATVKDAFDHAFSGLSKHPKFMALQTVLVDKARLPAFHGIVFARTREAVRSLARLIEACPGLKDVEVFAFMGHGGRKGDGGAKGMRVKEQQLVMEQFKAPGRKLMVSTSAGEEGIDVPSCEFVVRYTATQTGNFRGRMWCAWRERIQSRGRTRKPGSEYIEILEAGGQEQGLSAKSAREEAHMHHVLGKISAVRI